MQPERQSRWKPFAQRTEQKEAPSEQRRRPSDQPEGGRAPRFRWRGTTPATAEPSAGAGERPPAPPSARRARAGMPAKPVPPRSGWQTSARASVPPRGGWERPERSGGQARREAEHGGARDGGGTPQAPAEPRGKQFQGERISFGARVWVRQGDESRILRHQERHSPTGFDWGFRDSMRYGNGIRRGGPADLALAMLREIADERTVETCYQDLARDVLADLPRDGWVITEEELRRWLADHAHSARPRAYRPPW